MNPDPPLNPDPLSQTEIFPKPVAEWTVMVYLAGDNNLSAECIWALTEMQKGVSSDQVNVIAQFDPNDGLVPTRRYEITREAIRATEARAGKPRPYSKPSTNGTNGFSHDEIADLKLLDFAGFDDQTEEVRFFRESARARDLERRRIRENRKQQLLAASSLARGEGLSVIVKSEDLGASPNDTDAASPITLYNFLSYGIEAYPARHYLVILSGHSAGIEPTYLLRDDSSGGAMTFRQLKVVFDQLRRDFKAAKFKDRADRIDILGFDTCLMSMAEICCELVDRVDIVIGSETYTPSSGWPYQSILRDLCNSIEASDKGSKPLPRDVATMVVKNYRDFYKVYIAGGISVALSALDVTKVKDLAPVVKNLASVLTEELIWEHPELKNGLPKDQRPLTDALVLAHWEAQSYNGEWYVDLVDFCECLQRRYPEKGVNDACQGVITFLKDKIVIASEVCGPTYQYSNGVAIYFPWSSVAAYFWGFTFATESGWGDFLAYYTNLTRRKFRVPELKDLTGKELTDVESEQIRKRMKEFEESGANFLNYDRSADKMASDKRASDKRASDKGLGVNLSLNTMPAAKRASDKRASDKRASDKMGADRSGNPIHSMRNPPIVSHDFEF